MVKLELFWTVTVPLDCRPEVAVIRPAAVMVPEPVVEILPEVVIESPAVAG